MLESTDSKAIFTETLRVRSFHLCLWTILSAFFIAFVVPLYLSTNSAFVWIVIPFLGMIVTITPTINRLIGRVIVEVKTDGLYVETTFLFQRRLKLFGWEQVVSCEMKYYPTFGALGFYRSGLFAGWTYGSYGAWNQNTFPLLRWKPVFGEREFHSKITRNGVNPFVVMDSYTASDFICAVAQAASSFLNRSFNETIGGKPSLQERYYGPAMLFSLCLDRAGKARSVKLEHPVSFCFPRALSMTVWTSCVFPRLSLIRCLLSIFFWISLNNGLDLSGLLSWWRYNG